ncbi:MAG: wax ester/triacylglycerol synthase family O-acyltransferase [Mycobacterium sp.]
MQHPQRVSGFDASFLSIETATQPMQVFSVLELDSTTIPGGYRFNGLRDALAARVRAIPEFREKLSDAPLTIGHPVWVQDDDFDIDRHLHRITLPANGTRTELTEICGRLAGLPLDRRRPLWEIWVIEGLDGSSGTDRLAVLIKVHHAAADGVTFADMVSRLCSSEAAPTPPDLIEAPASIGPLREALDGAARLATRPFYLAVRVLPAAARAVLDAIRRARAGRAMAAPFTAPRTALNAKFSAQRNVAFARLDLDEVKRVKDHFGVKVNDVVGTLVGGVMRQFLLDRGELPTSSLVALEPVSVHGQSDRTARNQVSGMLVALHTQIADPVDRLKAVAEANASAKEQVSAISPTLLQDFGEVVGSVLLGIAKRVYARLTQFRPNYNIILSNVPGPDPARYFLGAAVSAMYPFGPVLLGAGINFTLWSVNGTLHIGLISSPEVIPALSDLADGLNAGLDELLTEIDGAGIGGAGTDSAAV